MNFKNAHTYALICFVTCGASVAPAIEPLPEDMPMAIEYREALGTIHLIGKRKELEGLRAFAVEELPAWKERSLPEYGALALELCIKLRSEFNDAITSVLTHQIASDALAMIDPEAEESIGLYTHSRLVGTLQDVERRAVVTPDAGQWPGGRRTRAERWMAVWDRAESVIDPEYSVNRDLPLFNIRRSLIWDFPGAASGNFEDEAQRAEYERLLAEDEARRLYHIQQQEAMKVKRSLRRTLVDFFREAYATPPYADEELAALLQQHIAEEEIRAEILAAVAEKKAVNEHLQALEAQVRAEQEALDREYEEWLRAEEARGQARTPEK